MGNILVPFKKFLSNKNTITILGVLLGVVILYLGYNWRVTKSIQPTKVPYALETLYAGDKIQETNIGYTNVPKDMTKEMSNLLVNVKDINGFLVAYDSKIPAHGFFFSENLIAEEDMPDSLFSNIQDGYTIISLEVDTKLTYGNSIFPDDSIDLYMYTTLDDGSIVYGRFIKSIQVLAVKDDDGNDVFTNKDDPGESAMLLFAVPERLFLLLKKAEKQKIVMEPVPRNASYSKNAAATELTSEQLESIILEKTYVISGECVDLTIC